MKRTIKSIKPMTLIFLTVMFAFASISMTVSAEELTTGSCGDNATYSFDNATGALTISGTGNTANYTSSNTSPFCNNESIKTVIVEEGITSLGTQLFLGCSNLEYVQLPESLNTIGDAAFINTALKEITIPKNVGSIGENAIPGENMETIIVDEQNAYYTAVDNVLFNKNMTELKVYCAKKVDTSYSVPDSVTTIGAFAFSDAKNLTDVILPVGLKVIGTAAFSSSMIDCITIPSTVTDIKNQAFYYCENLNAIIFMTADCVIYDNKDTIFNSGSMSITPTVYAASGSTAQQYASAYGLKYIPLCVDDTIDHNFEYIDYHSVCFETTNYYTCSKCNCSYSEVTHDDSHFWDYDACDYEHIEGTNTHKQICQYCGFQEEAPCVAGSADVKESTCTEEGVITYYCETCNGTFTDPIEKVPHVYSETVVSPTCMEQGYTEYVCANCGDAYKDNYTDALGHNFKDSEQTCLNGCGEVNPDYKAEDETTIKNTQSQVPKVTEPAEKVYNGPKKTTYDDYRVIPGYGQIKVAWTADDKLNGYDVYISTDNKNFKKYADIKAENGSFCIIDNLDRGKIYYVKLKGYLLFYRNKIEMNNESKVQAMTVK